MLGLFHVEDDGDSEAIAFVHYFDVVLLTDEMMNTLGCVNLKWSGNGTRLHWFDIVPVPCLAGFVPVLTIDYLTRLGAGTEDHEKVFDINRFFNQSGHIVY